MQVNKITAVIVFFVLLIPISEIFSQDNDTVGITRPRIAVKKLIVNNPEDIQLEVISKRVTDSTKQIMKFMNEYELTDSANSDLSSLEESGKSFLDYCNNNNIDNIVYGKTYIGSDDSYVIEMSVFSREKKQTALTRIGRAESALDIFEAADNLTASIIEEFSGVHIAFGNINLINIGVEGSFTPFIDGEPFASNLLHIENLLIGKRTIEIRQTRMLEETVIFSEEVIVKENSLSKITFKVPNLLPEESKVIRDYDKIININREKVRKKDKVTRAFNEIDTLLADTPYNITLSVLREEYRKKRTEWELYLTELGKREKREIIVGATTGVNIGFIDHRNDDDETDEFYDPIDVHDWNDEVHPGPVLGLNFQYQIYNSFYIQTEFNVKEIFFSDFDNQDNYIQIIEIPILLKLTKQFKKNRFSLYLGPSFYSIEKSGGVFNEEYVSGEFQSVDQRDGGSGFIAGMEYGYKTGRHILTAGLRLTSLMSILDYSYQNPSLDVFDSELVGTSAELLLGYGYNFGGSGRIETEENRNKWLFPAEAGFMIQSGESSDNTNIIFFGGGLRKFTENLYFGLKLFAFNEGGAPLLSMAYTKDPDKRIDNYSFIVVPLNGETIYAFQYNIGINRYNLGLFSGGPIGSGFDFSGAAVGITAGYFY